MGEDLSTGAKIGITLIILVALIGIVFALLTMMKNITNSGSNQLQNSLDQMSASSFADYDQKVVSGTNVVTAIKMFESQDVAIVVKNLLSDAKGQCPGGFCYNALLQGYGVSSADTTDIKSATAGTEGMKMGDYGKVYPGLTGTVNIIKNSHKEDICKTFKAADVSDDNYETYGLGLSEGGTYYVGALRKAGTNVLYNMNTKPVSASGSQTFIRDNASYRAMHIKDASGTIIGICFTEIEKG